MKVKKQQLEPDMEQQTGSILGKEYVDCILQPCLFNLYAEYIMKNSGLDEAQAGIKIARKNINELRYADDTTLMAENEELKSLLMKVKEENKKVGLKLQWGTITRQSGWLLSKSLQAINAGEGVEKREPSYTVGGNAN